jgi:hypothetical protein
MAMAKNTIGTLYDDNAVPIASGATGDGLSTYTGLNINNQTWNGTAYERTQSRQGAVVTTVGGVTTVAIAAGVATDTVVKASAGRLCKVLVTTTGTNPMAIWDNASGHTGTIIGAFAASPVVGTVVPFDMPAANGITVQGNAANPAVTISFI